MCLGLPFLIIVQKPATHQPFIQKPALGVADNPLLEMLYLILKPALHPFMANISFLPNTVQLKGER